MPKIRCLRGALDWVTQERDDARAELQKALEQEPIGQVDHSDCDVSGGERFIDIYPDQDLKVGQKVYAAPVPAMPMQSSPLSNDEIHNLLSGFELPMDTNSILDFARDIERAVIAKAMAMPSEISRELMSDIVDQVFDGAIEDDSVISDIYRIIASKCFLAMPIPKQELDKDGLLPLLPHDHPDCHAMIWTFSEIDAIKDYAARCIKASQAAAIPFNWLCVPINPTDEQISSVAKAYPGHGVSQYAQGIYHAMIFSAPKPNNI